MIFTNYELKYFYSSLAFLYDITISICEITYEYMDETNLLIPMYIKLY